MGYERQIAKHQSLQADVGVVFQYFIYNPEFQDKRGVKLKGEYRYYLGQYDFRKVGAYLAAEAYWNIVNFNRETSQTECYDLNCQSMFRRTYFYKVKYREEGLALKYGLMINAGGFIFDFNAGIALRFVDYKKPNLPPNREVLFDGQFIQIPNETKRIAPGVALGVRIGHTIGRIRNQ